MRRQVFSVLAPAAVALLLGGCCSDSTAPHDRLPPLENRGVAAQSGYLAAAMVDVAPVSLLYHDGKNKDKGLGDGFGLAAGAGDGDYIFSFAPGDPVQGTVYLHFRQGGAEGTPCSFETADWARAWTAAGRPLIVDLVPGGVSWLLGLELLSDIDRAAGAATVSGGGILVVGDYTADWSVAGLAVVDSGNWPSEGGLTLTNEGITAVVTYNGDHTATVEVEGETYIVDLNTGQLNGI